MQAGAGEPPARAAAIAALADRRQPEALPAVRKAAGDADAKVRQAALGALAALGAPEDLPKLVEILLGRDDPAERDTLERALSAIAGRIGDKDARCEPILQGLAKADDKAKVRLLAVLSALGGEKAYQSVRALLAGGSGEVKKAALRALGAWPDATPMADLLDAAKGDENPANKIIALRGYIRAVGLVSRPADGKLKAYRQALELAARPEEKKLVLAGLADTAHPEALKLAEACVAEAPLKNEALAAAEKIAESIAGKHPEEARAALKRVIEATGDGNLRNRATTALGKIKTPEPKQK
jgi:HEAT repeat protein